MIRFAIWIDRGNAKIFEFSREKMERTELKPSWFDHHTHRPDGQEDQQRERKLFEEVATGISSAHQILVLGPGVVKHHFVNFLNEHHPLLSKKVIACETVDHPTDLQIAAFAKQHFC